MELIACRVGVCCLVFVMVCSVLSDVCCVLRVAWFLCIAVRCALLVDCCVLFVACGCSCVCLVVCCLLCVIC